MGKLVDLTGQKFGRLTVVSRSPIGKKDAKWVCSCECGGNLVCLGYNLKTGATTSCGCFRKEEISRLRKMHGHSPSSTKKASPEWHSWNSMKQRCANPKRKSYADYGGRGISFCDRWGKFQNFLDDMGQRPENTTLDRIDNDGNYEPGNCRWATSVEQSNNRRRRSR